MAVDMYDIPKPRAGAYCQLANQGFKGRDRGRSGHGHQQPPTPFAHTDTYTYDRDKYYV